MAMVHDVLADLATHPPGCDCGCSWVHKADPAKVWRWPLDGSDRISETSSVGRSSCEPPATDIGPATPTMWWAVAALLLGARTAMV